MFTVQSFICTLILLFLCFLFLFHRTAVKEELVEESSSNNDEKEPDSELESEEVKQEENLEKDALGKPKLIMNPSVPNVIYIGHLPRDCEERALTEFLKQFGQVVQLRVCRSHKTGGSKGYAFAKFHSTEVAAIAAETLNGHLLFQKRLVSHVLAPEQNHAKLFSSNTPAKFLEKEKPRGSKSLEKMKEVTNKLKKGLSKKRAALKAMGIDYDVPEFGEVKKEEEEEEETPKKKRKKSTDATIEEETSSTPKQSKKEKAQSLSAKKIKKKKDKDRRKSA